MMTSAKVAEPRNRHDGEIRDALLRVVGPSSDDFMVVQEWAVGNAIVDVGTISSVAICGYEIKSAADSVTRLRSQVPQYSRALDVCTLVTTDNHLRHALKVLPQWWGIWVFRGGRIEIARPANENRENNAAHLLWSSELSKLLTEFGLGARAREEQKKIDEQWVTPPYKPFYRKTPTKHAKIAAVEMSPQVRSWVARALMARPGWRLANGRSARNYR